MNQLTNVIRHILSVLEISNSNKIPIFNNFTKKTHKYLYYPSSSSVYSLFSNRVGRPPQNTPFSGVFMKSIGAAFFLRPDAVPDVNHMAPNDTAYKRWSCHSGLKLLCKLCRTSPPPVMGSRFTGHADPLDGWRCCTQKWVMSRPIQVRQLYTRKSGFVISAINKYMSENRYP